MRLLGKLSQFSATHPWSHNEVYSPWVLRQARTIRRRGGDVALDVGCGTGLLLKRLARVMPEVVGLEPDARTAACARGTISEVDNATVLEAHFDPIAFDQNSFDLVTFVAVLHHLPLGQTLDAARKLLRPGGRLIVVGLAREVPADLPRSVTSMVLSPVIRLVRHPHRASEVPTSMTAPTAEPTETFDQIARVAREVLPGVKMRRGLFWRYTAVWIKGSE
jgi:2-polyprenyl-3-methyl-5-hydroxy-6-metoxy-1,4-benzoquinol methylase